MFRLTAVASTRHSLSTFRGLVAVAVVLAALTGARGENLPPPNVVMILIDDLGYGDLSCYGNEQIRTPHIDKLAREGLRFTQFTVASPICSPSRVGVTTGQFPARHLHPFVSQHSASQPAAGDAPTSSIPTAPTSPGRFKRPATRRPTSASGTWGAAATSGTPRCRGIRLRRVAGLV